MILEFISLPRCVKTQRGKILQILTVHMAILLIGYSFYDRP